MIYEPCVICGKRLVPASMACEECESKDPLSRIDGCDPRDYLDAEEVEYNNLATVLWRDTEVA